MRELEEQIDLDKKFKHDVAVVVDRLVMKDGLRRRLTDSVETAAQLADGLVEIETADGDTLTFSEKFACVHCGISLPEIQPRIFSFNSPHGACPACHGLGFTQEIDPELVVPDGSLSIDKGALLPYGQLSFGWLEQVFESIASHVRRRHGRAVGRAARRSSATSSCYGTGKERIPLSYRNYQGRMRHYTSSFPGILKHLMRRYAETESEQVRQKIEEYMADRPCPECHGARLKPTSLAVTVGERNIYDFTLHERARVARLPARAWSSPTPSASSAAASSRRSVERLSFLNDVGVGYLTLQRASATLSGGEAQRIRLATQIGSALVGVLYILDEPSIGLHQRDNRRLIDTLLRLRDLGNTVIVVEHDEETMRSADHIVDMGPGAGEHGGSVVAEGTPREVMDDPASLTGDFLAGRRTHRPARPAPPAGRVVHGARRAHAQPARHRRRLPGRRLHLRHRRLRLRQVHARQRDPLQGHGGAPQPRHQAARRRARRHRRRPAARQGHRHRPVAHRPHAALQPGHLHRRLRPHPPALRADARRASCAATSPGASASTSRAAAARPARATARSRSRCTSCRTSTCPARPAAASATTATRSRSGTRARTSPRCSR